MKARSWASRLSRVPRARYEHRVKGAPHEAEDRALLVRGEEADRLEHEVESLSRLEGAQAVHILEAAPGGQGNGPDAGPQFDLDPGGLERRRQIHEEDERVHIEVLERESSDLRRRLRVAHEFEEPARPSKFAIGREGAARLPHEPNRGPLHGFARERAQKKVVHGPPMLPRRAPLAKPPGWTRVRPVLACGPRPGISHRGSDHEPP